MQALFRVKSSVMCLCYRRVLIELQDTTNKYGVVSPPDNSWNNTAGLVE